MDRRRPRRHDAAFDKLRLTQDGVTPGLEPGLSKRDAKRHAGDTYR
ncbi:MAG: hypothetical protein ABL883_10500 [Terricaulis sp.]